MVLLGIGLCCTSPVRSNRLYMLWTVPSDELEISRYFPKGRFHSNSLPFDTPYGVLVHPTPMRLWLEAVYTHESSNSHAYCACAQPLLSYEYLYAVTLRTTHYRYAPRNVQTLLQSTVVHEYSFTTSVSMADWDGGLFLHGCFWFVHWLEKLHHVQYLLEHSHELMSAVRWQYISWCHPISWIYQGDSLSYQYTVYTSKWLISQLF